MPPTLAFHLAQKSLQVWIPGNESDSAADDRQRRSELPYDSMPKSDKRGSKKGFLQSEVLGEVSFLGGGGAVRGEVFREVCREVFHEVFGLVLLGHSEQKELQQKLQP